ncbi:universal stress protein [Aureisphaera galaxeae]|uniref:universal stress protein n=1 Tax=Aureisphaera galaxeae TaxID=1538023 RepID=UPI00234FCD2D|nr:universal stress protein [Aureisphaera galaxeae]MDC8003776.1 universal stress protein [Aureisphaera galaxeae]
MKRVILPTDFSENAYNAIRYAVQLFKGSPCTFYLLNTYTPASYYVGVNMINSYSALELEKMASANSRQGLDEVEERIKSEFVDPEHIYVKLSAFNMLAAEINELVANHNIDLVVMGTTGATGAKEVFLGTQTMHTIKRVECPVIAVPASFHYEVPKEILFATDFKFDRENRFLSLLKDISEMHVSRTNILNAYHGTPLDNSQEDKKSFLDAYFRNVAHVFHTAEGVDVVEAVEEFQVKHKINFLVMVHNKHSFFENLLFKPVINELVYHTKVPFMVIPSEERIHS